MTIKMGKTGKIMTPKELDTFLGKATRCELQENPGVYVKAIRASLYALGYDHDWCYSLNEYSGKGLMDAIRKRKDYPY